MNNFLEKIRNFKEEFATKLEVRGWKLEVRERKFLFCGMGGSHLAADLLKIYDPKIDIYIHSDYNLPKLSDLKERLVFIISYSGNTQETIFSLKSALKQKLKIVVITLNGKLLVLAEKYKLPVVILPDLNLQPRLAVGLMLRAILKIIDPQNCLRLENFMKKFNPRIYESQGQNLAKKIKNKIPIIYSSLENFPLANYFKISFNETSKIPAFANYFPELNHNEMVGFLSQKLDKNFCFIFLEDKKDKPLIKKRMKLLKNWLRKRNYQINSIQINKKNIFEKIFANVVLVLFSSYYLAQLNQIDPADEKLIDEFKKKIS